MCLRGRISLPLTGTWTADLSLDPASNPAVLPVEGAPVTVSLGEGGLTLKGAVLRGNLAFGTGLYRLVGGAGGLWNPLDPKAYQGATFSVVLNDILGQVGEQASSTISGGITGLTLPFWTVQEGPAFIALANLVLTARVLTGDPVNWRVLTDGTIFLGVESWPATALDSFELTRWSPQQLEAEFYATNPNLLPGETWQGGNVSNVEHNIEPERIRTKCWWLNPS